MQIHHGTPGVLIKGGQLSFSTDRNEQRPFFLFIQPADPASQLVDWRLVFAQTANGTGQTFALSLPPNPTPIKLPALGAVYRGAGSNVTVRNVIDFLVNIPATQGNEKLSIQFFEGRLNPYWTAGEVQPLARMPLFATEVAISNARSFDPETYEFIDPLGVPVFTTPPITTAAGTVRLPVPASSVSIRTTTPGHAASFSFRVLG